MLNFKFNIKKKKAFTLIEVMLTIIIFTLIVIAFYSGMTSLYVNTNKEYSFTENMYKSVEDVEIISNKIKNLGLKYDYNNSTKIKDMKNKDFILSKYPNLNEDSTLLDIISLIRNELRVDRIIENDEFVVFNGKYECKIKGYCVQNSLYNQEGESSINYTYFLPNNYNQDIKLPDYSAYIHQDEELVRYVYLDNMLKNNNIAGKYEITEETKPYAYSQKLDWEINKTKKNGTNLFFEPVFNLDNNILPENSFNKSYPVDKKYFSSLACNKDHPIVTKDKIKQTLNVTTDVLRDFYLRFKVTPITDTNTDLEPVYSDSIWVISLPVTDNLLYHFDLATCGEYLDSSINNNSQPLESKVLKLPSLTKTLDNPKEIGNLYEKNGNQIKIYKGNEYGKYIELNKKNDNFVYNLSENSNVSKTNYGELTLFMIVDTKNANKGNIIQRKANLSNYRSFIIEYLGGNEFKLTSKPARTDVTNNGLNRDKHIIAAKVDWESLRRRHYLAVDQLNFKKSGWRLLPQFNRKNPLFLGGSDGMKIYEIIAYDKVLEDSDIETVFNYLKDKYSL